MKKKIPVYGMHCKACELLIENKLSEMEGVKLESISQANHCIEVDIKSEKKLEEIQKTIESLGYHTQQKQLKGNTFFDYVIIFLSFIIFGLLYLLFREVDFFSQFSSANNLTFFVIVGIGLVASLSSCLAVTGGIVMGFSQYIDTSKGSLAHIKMHGSFHLGRVLGFTLLGGVLGSIGGYIGSFGSLNKVLLFLAGLFMFLMGLHMLNIFPTLKNIALPKTFAKKILGVKNPLFAPLIGALTFFLPCGFTQSMQVYAASSGSFLSGAMIMGAFALGTFPVLFLVGFGSSYFKDKNFEFVHKIMGVLVIYFSVFILSGFTNFFHFSSGTSSQPAQTSSVQQENKQVTVSHDGYDLVPENIVLSGARNYTLTILPSSDGQGCKYALTIPGLDNNEYQIKKGVPIVLHIQNPSPGSYKVVCTAMGMKHGTITIE